MRLAIGPQNHFCRQRLAGAITTHLRMPFLMQIVAIAIIPMAALAQDNSDADAHSTPETLTAQDDSDAAAQEDPGASGEDGPGAGTQDPDATTQEDASATTQESPDAAAQNVDTVPVVPLAEEQQDVGAADAVVLDDVVVTSEKRNASIQDVPLTVEAITGQALAKHGITDFKDIQSLVPGLDLDDTGQIQPKVTLRGVPFDPNTNTNPATDVYFNEVPIYTYVAFQSMFDVERVEVLRGAQTTLRARTSPGGAITIAPRKPNLGAWEASVAGNTTTNDATGFWLAGGGPLIDGILGARLAGMSDSNALNGVTNVNSNRSEKSETEAWRIVVDARPFESESVGVTLTHQHLKSDLSPYWHLMSAEGSTREPYIGPYDRKGRVNIDPSIVTYAPVTTLAIDWDDVFAGHTLNLLTGYQTGYQDTYRDVDIGNAWPAAQHPQFIGIDIAKPWWTNEIRLSSPQDQPWRYRVGAFYEQIGVEVEIFQRLNATAVDDPNVPPQSSWDVYLFVPLDSSSYSLFAETGLDIGEKWSVELGVRQGSTSYYTQVYLTPKNHPANLEDVEALRNIAVIPADLTTVNPKPLTGHFVASYHVTNDLLTFARYARSSRQDGINIEAIAVSTALGRDLLKFEPEYADSLELGLKSDWLGGRLRFNAALVHQAFDGYISKSPFVPYDVDRNGQQDGFISVGFNGDAIVNTAEASLTYAWSENLQLSWGGAYSKGRFDNAVAVCAKYVEDANGEDQPEFTDENGNPGQQVARCISNGPLGPVPEFSTTLQGEYTYPLSPFDLFLRGSYRYDGERGQPNAEGLTLPAYGTANLFFGAHNAAQTWEVSVWAKNLFDEEALIAGGLGEVGVASDCSAFGFPNNCYVFDSGYTVVYPIQGREAGLSLRYAW